jgi:hypothetical protein
MAICTAKRSNGTPCRQYAIRGCNVCVTHGGAAPQVRRAAALRLASLIDPAIGVLSKSMKSKSESISLAAARDVLDRNQMKDALQVQLLGPDDGPIKVQFDAEALTDEQLRIALEFARTVKEDSGDAGGIDSDTDGGIQ